MEGAPWYEALIHADPREFAAAGDAEGRAWIAALPELLDAICRSWGLTIEERIAHTGYSAIVLPVRHDGAPLVLKFTWPTARAVIEGRALAAWNGQGVVKMVRVATGNGALLLERLDAQRTLHDLPLAEAATVAGRLLRRLAVPAPPGFPLLPEVTSEIIRTLTERQERLGRPVPVATLKTARSLAEELSHSAGHRFLIHADLHYGNILAAEREPWLAIDPRPVAGEPEYAVAELLWTRVDEVEDAAGVRHLLNTLVSSGTLDASRARQWAIVRCVDYWLWGIDHGLTRDPLRCQRILQALL